jgi:STE24 endopeptidase
LTASDVFSAEEVDRSRAYHRPLYLLLVLETAVTAGWWAAAWAWAVYPFGEWPWPAAAAAYGAALVAGLALLLLPLSFWRGFVRERRWGFSTQTLPGWLADRVKGIAVAIVLTVAPVLGLVASAQVLPRWWPFVAAPAAALLVLLLTFVAPVVLEPLFNRFAPLADEALASDLRALARQAGVPVRDVLVADASRRTRKTNAYVSGLGGTRRVVLYDTLLEGSDADDTRLVVAHELGHRRARHVAKATLLGMAGAVAAVACVWAAVREPGDPRSIPLVVLVAIGLQIVALPLGSWISRRWERVADRFSLELTGDLGTFERAHVRLARTNLSDLDPPRPLYALLFSHPTPPERIALAREWARTAGAGA